MNRFVFIIPFRNVKDYINECANSLINQKNKNWIAIFCDDASTDGSTDSLPSDSRFSVIRNNERISALPNIHYGIMDSNLNDDDIICLLDGDDKLIVDSALDTIDSLYNDNTLLTYGQYIWPNGHIGHCKEYTEYEFSMLRKGGYWASHLRTFKFKLYKELIKQDPKLNCYKDNLGEFYKSCYDVAIMTPLMEIAGFDNIKFNPTPVYFYRLHEQNDHSVDPILQKNIADEVFNKNPFKKIY
jgi:glycosyltransferase involved in cell wall biosynthesis